MPISQAIVLGVVQGLAEFLPVSSRAHLILVPWLFGWQDPGLPFDVALHWGTLVAVLVGCNGPAERYLPRALRSCASAADST